MTDGVCGSFLYNFLGTSRAIVINRGREFFVLWCGRIMIAHQIVVGRLKYAKQTSLGLICKSRYGLVMAQSMRLRLKRTRGTVRRMTTHSNRSRRGASSSDCDHLIES